MQREMLVYDVVVVGAGPSGLAVAIKLKQLAKIHSVELKVAVLEKGSSVGANIISGCVMDTSGLDELIPNWRELGFPVDTMVTRERLAFFTSRKSYTLPLPRKWNNCGNYIISLSRLCSALGQYAEDIGVEIYSGFAASLPIIEKDVLCGIVTIDVGKDRSGKPSPNYQAGIEIRAKQTVLAEGCRGSLTKQIIKQFSLDTNCVPQTYGLGIKEVWQVESSRHQLGYMLHSLGYPLNNLAYGGGFIYHFADNLVSVGLVTALDYSNPYLDPYEEFQKFKHHSEIATTLKNGKRLEYGARTIVEGGIQAIPRLNFPGGVLVGDSAGLVNVPKVKGVHNAIKSGVMAANALFDTITKQQNEAVSYTSYFLSSSIYKELYMVRNIRPAFGGGLFCGIIYTAIEYYVFKGLTLWTFRRKIGDHQRLLHKSKFKPLRYAKADGVLSFDRASSLYLANVHHDGNQMNHLLLADQNTPITVNLTHYASPEIRYCPSGVYEIIHTKSGAYYLQINSQNCVHCKACDIKDPTANITWTPPENGSGPQYSEM